MGIYYGEKNKIFNITAKNSSYILKVANTGHILHLHWGKKLRGTDQDNLISLGRWGSFTATTDYQDDFCLETLPQEYPSYGNTDLRSPALQVQLENGTTITDLRYESHCIYTGKPKLEGLPATYIENEEDADTLEIITKDQVSGLKVLLIYTAFRNYDVVTRSARFVNEGNENLKILRALSSSIDYRHDNFDLLQLSGSWARERHVVRRPLSSGIQSIESRRGASSHNQNPFIALMSKNADEEHGEVFGFNLVYSGNFIASVEVDQYNKSRVQLGVNPFDFSWLLEPGQEFQTPEVVMAYSHSGLGKMSETYHNLYKNHLCRGKFKDKARPILINNWEATYFDFNEEKIKKIATEASQLGIELFVLDDGWFGKRYADVDSLGDWYVNKDKLPNGLGSLAKEIENMGMKFGLWFEPEMVSMDSDLYRAHPEWCIHVPMRKRSLARNQFVLDLSREDVCNYIIESISKILSSAAISYVKWDMNRNMTEIGSEILPAERQRETAHRYMLGLYKVLEEITSRFPDVLFESCSGGGGRFDPGMLYYMPQTWTSDNTDAIERLKIQYGTSIVYPNISMGCHVSAVPNHQVHRITPLQTRGCAAMAGNFGYELDITKMTPEEKEIIKEQVKLYKEIRNTVQFGSFHRLISPFKGNDAAWMFISEDKTEIIVSYFIKLCEANTDSKRLKLQGLNPESDYFIHGSSIKIGGDELMYVGLEIPEMQGDFQSYMWRLKIAE